MSASSSMTRSSRRRRRARRAKAILRTTSQSRLRLDSSPGRGALGRPGQPCCSLGPDGAQSSGPCSRHCIAAVNLNSGARPFPIAKNFARSARPLPTRQWLPYQGSWHREAMTERLYYIPRFRFALRLPEGYPPCNLSVTFGDTSPGRRGLGIAQTSSLRQRLPYQGSWRAQARLRGCATCCFTVSGERASRSDDGAVAPSQNVKIYKNT